MLTEYATGIAVACAVTILSLTIIEGEEDDNKFERAIIKHIPIEMRACHVPIKR